MLASAFAYGRVQQILASLEILFSPFSDRPSQWIREGAVDQWRTLYEGFRHRFQNQEDLVAFLWLLQDTLRRFGSIENSFFSICCKGQKAELDLRLSLTCWAHYFRQRLRDYPLRHRIPDPRGIYHLLPDPASGSPCKRWNLYLRWMVRGPDALDVGIWKCLTPSQLILPLDTHTARICRNLQLTGRTVPSWSMAEEITKQLKRLDPEDPVRYDFSLAWLGISERCPRRGTPAHCRPCDLRTICHAQESG